MIDHGADWVISSDADEFWWPRGESLPDVLAVIPERYEVVQALVREFRPRAGDGEFGERLTIRPSLEVSRARDPEPLRVGASSGLSRASGALDRARRRDGERSPRSAPRLVPDRGLAVSVSQQGAGRAPVRKRVVLGHETRSTAEAGTAHRQPRRGARERRTRSSRLSDDGVRAGLADGSLVEDVRLRDALRSLRVTSHEGRPEFDALELRAPGIVDDAAYAVECAAVGEVDLARLDRHIRELEERIGVLEARFWPRVARTLSRAVRR